MKWHLTTFEAWTDTFASTGFLALVSFTGSLAVAGAFATADTLTTLLSARAGLDIMESHKLFKM
jgi:hypothetical protein